MKSTRGGRSDSWQDRLLYTMACHASVKAGMSLTTDESRELIRRLEQSEQPHTCPHGRPTMIHLDAGGAGVPVRPTLTIGQHE